MSTKPGQLQLQYDALRVIDEGPAEGERWAMQRQSRERFVVPALATRLGVPERVVQATLEAWMQAGTVREVEYRRPSPSRSRAKGLTVDPVALAEAARAAGEAAADYQLPF